MSRALLLIIVLCVAASTATTGYAQWANEPVGSQLIVDCPMASASSCGLTDVYNSLLSRSESTGGMISPPSTLASILYAGAGNGGSQVEKYFSTSYPDIYFGIMLRTSVPFESWNCCANKMFFLRGNGTNGFFGLNKYGSSATLYFGHNTGVVNGVQLDNSHICSADYGLGGCGQNVDQSPLIHGQWTKLEVYMKASTTATSRDGILRMWKNESKIMEYTTLNYPNGFNNWIWSETIFNLPPFSNNKEWVFDHMHLSIPNCGGTGCGGGGTTPPPLPLPPNMPTNLRVQ